MSIDPTDQIPKRRMPDQDVETDARQPSKTSRLVAHVTALPFVVHVVAVSILLIILLPIIHPSGTWTSDEGAVRAQVEFLQDNGSWSRERPFADLDPEGVTSPIHASTVDGDRYSPYTKHPLLPTLLGPLRSLLEDWALVLPALLGTVAAATVGALIAGFIDPRIRLLSLWTLAFASPLFFYGYTVLGHTIAAALGAIAMLVVLRSGERFSATWLVAFGAMFAASLFRAEAFAYGIALAIAVIVAQREVRWGVRASFAGTIAAASVAGLIVNQRWADAVGGAEPVSEGQRILDWFRFVSGAFSSLILVDFGTAALLGVVILMTGGAVLVVLAVDREPHNRRFHGVVAAVSIAGSLSLVFLSPVPVGGLIAATPVLIAGLLLVRRQDLANRTIRLVVISALVFFAAVFLTQERGGGGAQWGGRYLMMIVPILVPLAIFLLRRLLQSAPHAARFVVVPLVVATLVLTLDATLVLRTGRESSADLTQRLIELAEDVGRSDSAGPVILSSRTHIGRHAWRTIEDIDYFLVPEEAFEIYLDRLVATGANRFGVVGAWTPDRSALFQSYGLQAIDPTTTPFIVVGPGDG